MSELLFGCPVCGRTKGFVAVIKLSNCLVCESCFYEPLAEDVMLGSEKWKERAKELEEMTNKYVKKLARNADV